ncbi:MAG: DegT/DnrJ/EryC1/StrS family aminotransferase [Acidobacteria bacterium]|nr:MAG: DegT/DnrJ/EryC1/StrS family aminotransferase [Acidobacteriota bacterium]
MQTSGSTKSKLALFGGTPVRGHEKRWPEWPQFDETDKQALLGVLESRRWWDGERVQIFQKEFAALQDAGHCVVCNSGTTALIIALRALGVGPGDEVIVPPYTFVATASAVAWMGAVPVFVDVDETWNLDIDLAEGAVTERTKAIIPVHFGGALCDMDRLNALSEKHGVWIVEDACHAWGAKWKGKGAGALGRCGTFSFQQSKNMTAGEGGAIVTDDEELAVLCRSLVDCGRGTDGIWYNHPRVGTNARLSEFQAALLSAQLLRLEAQNEVRQTNAAILNQGLGRIEGLVAQPRDPRETRPVYHLYCLRVDPARFGCSRQRLIEAADREGLPLSAGYARPLNRQGAFLDGPNRQRYEVSLCPVAEDLCQTSALWLTHPVLLGTPEDMRDIVEIFQKIKAHASELNTGEGER